MIKIAFCDDDLLVLKDISALFEKYCIEQNQKIEYMAFMSPLELLAEIEKGNRFDIVFLDVLMPGENGIEAAAEIRNYDKNVKIIFLTSSAEFAVESYAVDAYFYQLKPILKDKLFPLLDSVLEECEKEKTNSLILRCKKGISRVELKNVEYCEVIHRTLFIHLINGNILESIGSMEELSKQLTNYKEFIRPHRSYLVNLGYIQNLSYKTITMSSLAEIPIPRGKYNEIKNAFLEYSFQNKSLLI